jgi:RNA 2',3'-cyclic 3'-phosphodiesterase
MIRLFTAVEMPETIRQELSSLEIGKSETLVPSTPEQLHITLQFIGEVTESQSEELRERFLAIKFASFPQELKGVGAFESDDRPGFLWTGVSISSQLVALRDAIGVEMEAVGMQLETRPYKPHITLARLDAPDSALVESFLSRNGDFATSFDVESFALYSSSRGADGPVFNVVERFNLL